MRVGVKGGARLSKDPDSTAHWRLVEFGSEHNSPAKPFMRPALANNIQPVTDKFVSQLSVAIDKQIGKRK
jgi:HK97 gp10 family phage protein